MAVLSSCGGGDEEQVLIKTHITSMSTVRSRNKEARSIDGFIETLSWCRGFS